jgi:tRNA uridine 5-carbamoylmethylation protein Kti12
MPLLTLSVQSLSPCGKIIYCYLFRRPCFGIEKNRKTTHSIVVVQREPETLIAYNHLRFQRPVRRVCQRSGRSYSTGARNKYPMRLKYPEDEV